MRTLIAAAVMLLTTCTARNITLDAARQIARNEQAIEMVRSAIPDPAQREQVIAALQASSQQIEQSERARDSAVRNEQRNFFSFCLGVVLGLGVAALLAQRRG